MKYLCSLIIGLLTILFSFAQQPKVSADTFCFTKYRLTKTIILRSDSTYLLREKGFERLSLSMGFWSRKKDIYALSGLYNTSVVAKTETNLIYYDEDSLVIFKVVDCYGNSIPNYYFTFFDKNLSFDTAYTQNNQTDDKGILLVNKKKFTFFTTESDESNVEDNRGFWNDIFYRPIFPNSKKVVITLSFPKYFVTKNVDNNNLYMFRLRKFRLKGKKFLDIKNGNKFLKK